MHKHEKYNATETDIRTEIYTEASKISTNN